MELREQEKALDLLWMEKMIAMQYQHAYLSSINKELRYQLEEMQTESNHLYSRLYQEMLQRGWVQTRVEAQNNIESALLYWEQYREKYPELQHQE
jgi:hypothetical protein